MPRLLRARRARENRPRPVDAAERVRRELLQMINRSAAELAHQVEFALGTVKGAGPLRLRHAFEIAERLERDELQAKRC